LRYSPSIPKLLYTLRMSDCQSNSALIEFDNSLRNGLSTILNVEFEFDDQWSQASLPVRDGGLEFGVLSCWYHQPSWLRLRARRISRTVFFLHIYPLSQTHLSRYHSVLGRRCLSPLFLSALLDVLDINIHLIDMTCNTSKTVCMVFNPVCRQDRKSVV